MTPPQTALLGFAIWTLLALLFTVGVYRWSRILTGRAAIHEFRPDAPNGPDWYRRALRAHANCIENLPVFAAIVVTASMVGAAGRLLDALAVGILCARIGQTVTHVAFLETTRAVAVRFAFYLAQVVAMFAMAVLVLRR